MITASWTTDLIDNAASAAAVLGGLAALLALASWARALFRRTLGRKRDRYERLGRLGAGAQLSFFVAVHGEPPAIRRTITSLAYDVVSCGDPGWDPDIADDVDDSHDVLVERTYRECIFVDPLYYLQTITDDEDTVLAFSVTTRRLRFRPTFKAPAPLRPLEYVAFRREFGHWFKPLFRVRLGNTKFSDLDASDPEEFHAPHFRATPAARMWSYSEFNYYGNPGHYLTYVFTASSSAPGPSAGSLLFEIIDQAGYREWPYLARPDPLEREPREPGTEPGWEKLTAAREFRRRTAITTITVIDSALWAVNFPSTFGPHGDEVRLLP